MNRRSSDPNGEDHTNNRNGFTVQLPFNLGGLTGRGSIAIVALVILGIFLTAAALVYVNYVGFKTIELVLKETSLMSTMQHGNLTEAQDRFSCIVSLTMEERQRFRQDPNWNKWCSWLK